MAGSIRIRKVGDDWCAEVEGDDYSRAYTRLTEKKVHDLIDQLDEAAVQGAPWGIFEESTR